MNPIRSVYVDRGWEPLFQPPPPAPKRAPVMLATVAGPPTHGKRCYWWWYQYLGLHLHNSAVLVTHTDGFCFVFLFFTTSRFQIRFRFTIIRQMNKQGIQIHSIHAAVKTNAARERAA